MKRKHKKIHLIIIVIILNLLLVSCTSEVNNETSLFINILEGNEISDIVFYKGYLYAGGLEGVYRISPDDYTSEKINVGDVFLVKDLIADDKYLYIGHDSGITIYDGVNHSVILDDKFDVPDVRINSLMFDNDDSLWAGTYSGALKHTGDKWKNISIDDGLMDDTIFLIMQDSYGGMLFGHYASSNSGISYLKDNTWSYFTVDEGLPHNYITAGIMGNNEIYIATGFYDLGGIAVFDVSSNGISLSKTIIKKWGENGYKARSISLDNDFLWIGTEYNGICILQNEGFVQLNIDDGLSNNEVKSIYFDNKNMVWLGTRNGISIIDKLEIYYEFNQKK
ncbi:MAG: hypothetical protein KAH05_00340 [Clostridiales bacterium]|nr:hypothetical protein [Clostridiales bacterium]